MVHKRVGYRSGKFKLWTMTISNFFKISFSKLFKMNLFIFGKIFKLIFQLHDFWQFRLILQQFWAGSTEKYVGPILI